MRSLSLFFALMLFLGLSLPASARGPQPQVVGAWVRLPVIAGRPGAAYMRITAPHGDRLIAVSSPIARSAMIHESSMEGGVMRMDEVAGIALPAGQSVALAPGGAHIMLFDLKPVKPGQKILLILQFEKSGSQRVEALAQAATAPAP